LQNHYTNIQQKLDSRKAENAFRELKINANLIDFCSNDYLGLSSEKEIHHIDIQMQYGATGSRLISGNHQLTIDTEEYLAEYYKADSALIFNSGYNANLGLFSCIPQRGDTIIYDELIHASIRDGMRLSNVNNYSFEHNNCTSLENKLKNAKGNTYVAIESIYSMDGDEAPLKEIAVICKKYNAALIVDEAHSVGVFGEKGEGLVVQYALEKSVFARVVTFGKAMGCHGAAVLGNQQLRDYLINYSRSFIYTTALPLPSIQVIKNAHSFLSKNIDRKERLKNLIEHFKLSVSSLKLEMINSDSAIHCIIINGNDKVKELSTSIQNKGFDVRPILYPTVPKGKERIRICLHTFNTKEQIDDLIYLLKI
jgi:8-amino-7-oxononanoate synthase